ncbi:MAG TPA: bifunctional nuclease family protein [Chitinispirillaceae bacterium]|jgi:bifunctional DNase/RNase|nr:bifunctional nuclease family protein [Fibrobacter sp.]HLV30376.1 bifunctional nuclease family protein [Chitinispirillaceae bacterium]
MLIQVEVFSFAVDPARNSPVIILKETSGDRTLPVPIGPLEASAIAIESLKVTPEKPLTIDLTKIIMEQLGGVLTRAVIYDIIDQSLQARLQITDNNTMIFIDCRPCDALAMALRCDTPIFVNDAVLEKSSAENSSETDKLRKNISSTDTTEFGRYFLE